jgi:hypothetical protein
MKLTELTGIKNKNVPDEILNQKTNKDVQFGYITALLQQNNFEKIGSGAYATTYKSKNSVLKVFSDDPAYEGYIDFIKSIPTEYKRFVPKVTSVREFPQNKNIKFIKLPYYERLKFEQKYQLGIITNIISDITYNSDSYPDNFHKFKIVNVDDFVSKLEEYGFFNREIYSREEIEENLFKSLYNFIMFIRNNNPNPENFRNDMHFNNFMYDPKSRNIILTDPWATRNG